MATINSFNNQVLDANVLFNGGTFGAGTDATANTISIGTSGARLINIGSTTSLAITIACGTAGISVGTTANNHTSTFGSTNGTSTTIVQAGSGGITLTGAVTSANAISVTSGNITATSGNLVLTAATTSSVGQITQAGARLVHTYGTNNTFLGNSAGNFTLSGTDNVGIGYQAGLALSSANFNTYVGSQAGLANTTADSNTAVGALALTDVTSGSTNVGIGTGALSSLLTGSSNIAIGDLAGSNFTTNEDFNICIGSIGGTGDTHITRIGTTQTIAYIAGDVEASGQLNAGGDSGAPLSGITGITNWEDVTVGGGGGVFRILSKSANNLDSSGFIKIYVRNTAFYIPVFSSPSP